MKLYKLVDRYDCVGPEEYNPDDENSPPLRCEDPWSGKPQLERCKISVEATTQDIFAEWDNRRPRIEAPNENQ